MTEQDKKKQNNDGNGQSDITHLDVTHSSNTATRRLSQKNTKTKMILLFSILFICVSKAKSQAKTYGHSMYREVCFLFTHGLLHLLKMDHLNKEDEEKMIAMQNEIMDHFKIVR